MQSRWKGGIDYGLGTIYAIVTAILIAIQEPFSALAARTLTSMDFLALTQLALLFSLPILLAQEKSRRDFAAILLDTRHWPKLAIIFLVGVAGLELYDVGLSSAHPIITAAVLNLSPFWATLVAFAFSRRSISVPAPVFMASFVVAFCGATWRSHGAKSTSTTESSLMTSFSISCTVDGSTPFPCPRSSP